MLNRTHELSPIELIEKTRKILVELYIGCEEDFIKGLQIFEQIVENQIKQTSDIQISNLKKSLKETLEDTDLSPDSETSQSSNNGSNSDPNSSNSTTQTSTQPPPEQIDGSVSDPEQKNTPFSQEAQPGTEGSQNQPLIEGSQNQPGTEGSQNPPLIEGSQNPPPIQVPLQVNSTGVINTTPQLPIVAEQNMVPNENKLIQPLDNTSTDKLSNLPENSEEVGQVSAIN